MNKEAYLKEMYNSAFNDELEKIGYYGITPRAAKGLGDLITAAAGATAVAGTAGAYGAYKLTKALLKNKDKKGKK